MRHPSLSSPGLGAPRTPPLYSPHICAVFRTVVSDPGGCALSVILPMLIVVYFPSKCLYLEGVRFLGPWFPGISGVVLGVVWCGAWTCA